MSQKEITETEKLGALLLGYFTVFAIMGAGVFGKQLVQLRKTFK